VENHLQDVDLRMVAKKQIQGVENHIVVVAQIEVPKLTHSK
jgi:hypothetical protein